MTTDTNNRRAAADAGVKALRADIASLAPFDAAAAVEMDALLKLLEGRLRGIRKRADRFDVPRASGIDRPYTPVRRP